MSEINFEIKPIETKHATNNQIDKLSFKLVKYFRTDQGHVNLSDFIKNLNQTRATGSFVITINFRLILTEKITNKIYHNVHTYEINFKAITVNKRPNDASIDMLFAVFVFVSVQRYKSLHLNFNIDMTIDWNANIICIFGVSGR